MIPWTSNESPPIIPSIVSQHAEEAAFQWLLRDAAVDAPHYTLQDLAKLDNRVEAHLDGLRIAGEPGWEIVCEQLEWEEAGEVFTAASLAFENGDAGKVESVLAVAEQSLEQAQAAVSALGWMPWEQAAPHVEALLTSASPLRQRMGIAAIAVHRQPAYPSLARGLTSAEPVVRARALQAIGEFGQKDLASTIRANLAHPDESCRFRAAWSGVLIGTTDALPVLRRFVEEGGEACERAAFLAGRVLDLREALAWQRRLFQNPSTKRVAVQLVGILGDPVSVDWLLEVMHAPTLARLAGEAFTMITGLDLALEDFDTDAPSDFQAGPTEDPDDEAVTLDDDEDLPWPDPSLLAEWWRARKSDYQDHQRYFSGRPVGELDTGRVLATGYQRQRAAAALERALARPGTALFNTRAPGYRQAALLHS